MPSARYQVLIKPEDIQPDAPPPELTPQQKRENFWFYHKWHLVLGLAVCAILFSLVWEIVTQVKPDYTIGLIGTRGLPAGIGELLSEQLTPYFDDRNGDGKVTVNVMEYAIAVGDAVDSADPNAQIAGFTRLVGDLETGDSMLFITDDVQYFEEQYLLFAYNDGSVPEEGVQPDYTRMGVRWGDCPVLTSLTLSGPAALGSDSDIDFQPFLQDFQLVQRYVAGTALEDDEDILAYHAACVEKFNELTQQA